MILNLLSLPWTESYGELTASDLAFPSCCSLWLLWICTILTPSLLRASHKHLWVRHLMTDKPQVTWTHHFQEQPSRRTTNEHASKYTSPDKDKKPYMERSNANGWMLFLPTNRNAGTKIKWFTYHLKHFPEMQAPLKCLPKEGQITWECSILENIYFMQQNVPHFS